MIIKNEETAWQVLAWQSLRFLGGYLKITGDSRGQDMSSLSTTELATGNGHTQRKLVKLRKTSHAVLMSLTWNKASLYAGFRFMIV